MVPPPHRKRVRHFNDVGHCHELTFSCHQRRPLLDRDDYRRLFSKAIDAAVARLGFSLVAFVYMPEHVHLLVWAKDEIADVSVLLYAIKRPFSYRIKELMQQEQNPLLKELTILERPGKWVFRFWLEGGGYDRNLVTSAAIHASVEYFHNNPVRRGLCVSPSEWKWSSWRHYHLPDESPDSDLPKVDGLPVM